VLSTILGVRRLLCSVLRWDICAFSSLGIVLLVLTVGAIALFSGTRGSCMGAGADRGVISALYPVPCYAPYHWSGDKAVTHGASLSDRSESIKRACEACVKSFGTALLELAKNDRHCLVAEWHDGFFGFACQVLLLSG